MKKATFFTFALLITTRVSFGQVMSGAYQVGTGQTYATLGAVLDAVNTNGVAGNVVS